MSSEARKQRQKEKNKQKRDLPKSNKPKKADRITIENTPFGNIDLQNTARNQLIQTMFKKANEGLFKFKIDLFSKKPLKAEWKGISAIPNGRGNFSNKIHYLISWEEAASVAKKIGFTKDIVQKNTPIENIEKFLPQILYLTTIRAQKIKKMQEDKDRMEGKDSTDSNDNEKTSKNTAKPEETPLKRDGTILIVEDRLEEKIGSFEEAIKVQGYDIVIAEDLKTARLMIDELLKKNKLDGIILDFAIPVDEKDRSSVINDVPNGVVLFSEFLFRLNNRRIPVVINTTSDEEKKKKHLGALNIEMPLYNFNHELTPLSSTEQSAYVRREILSMFNTRNQERRESEKIKQDRDWGGKGKSVYVGRDGKYHYRGEE